MTTVSARDGGERPLTARGRDRRQSLLDYATQRFAENGFHPTSVSDIVDGIGVGKGVFYWYFPSKDDLLLEILRQALYSLRTSQQRAIDGVDDPLTRLELGIRTSLTWAADHPDVIRLAMFGWTEDRFAVSLRKGRRVTIDDTARHVKDAMAAGTIAEGDPIALAAAVCGITDEMSRQVAVGSVGAIDEIVDTAVRLCLYGVVGER